MKRIKDYMLADAGNYLVSSQKNRGIQLPWEEDVTFEEYPIGEMTYEENELGILVCGLLCVQRGCKDIKMKIIKCWYSNDDQIAVILNKDKGGEYVTDYDRMQGWRDWAGEVASYISEHYPAEDETTE